jgi:outer membrane protein TolC
MVVRYILFCFCFLLSPLIQAQESVLTEISYPYLEKLIAAAKTNYPRVKVYESKTEIAKLAVKKARLDWFNIFTLTYLYSPNNSTTLVNPTLLNGFQVGGFTSIGNIFQKPVVIKTAREDYNVAMLNQEEYLVNLEAMVKQRYYNYVQQKSILNWRVKTSEYAQSALNEIKHKFEKGEDGYENYNKAISYYSNTIQFKMEAEGAFLIAKSNLEELIGVKLESIK